MSFVELMQDVESIVQTKKELAVWNCTLSVNLAELNLRSSKGEDVSRERKEYDSEYSKFRFALALFDARLPSGLAQDYLERI